MKCPTVSNFVGCIDLRLANIGIGIFFVVATLLTFLYRCLEENLNGAEVRLEAIPFCEYIFSSVCNDIRYHYVMLEKKCVQKGCRNVACVEHIIVV